MSSLFRRNYFAEIREDSRCLKLDLRYATEDNICRRPLYRDSRLYLRHEAKIFLDKAIFLFQERERRGSDYRLRIWDGYRPEAVQRALWNQCPDERYVANPDKGGSMHSRGVAVDLTLEEREVFAAGRNFRGRDTTRWVPLDMGTDFDDMSPAAHWDAPDITPEQQKNRELLRSIMEGAGFKPFETEWWHWWLPEEYSDDDGPWIVLDEKYLSHGPLSHPDLLPSQ